MKKKYTTKKNSKIMYKISSYDTDKGTLKAAFNKYGLRININVINILMSYPKDSNGDYDYNDNTSSRFGFTKKEIKEYRRSKDTTPSSVSTSSQSTKKSTDSDKLLEQETIRQIELRKEFNEKKRQLEEEAFQKRYREKKQQELSAIKPNPEQKELSLKEEEDILLDMKDKLKEPMSSEDGDKLLYDIKNQELIVNSLKIQNKSSFL